MAWKSSETGLRVEAHRVRRPICGERIVHQANSQFQQVLAAPQIISIVFASLVPGCGATE